MNYTNKTSKRTLQFFEDCRDYTLEVLHLHIAGQNPLYHPAVDELCWRCNLDTIQTITNWYDGIANMSQEKLDKRIEYSYFASIHGNFDISGCTEEQIAQEFHVFKTRLHEALRNRVHSANTEAVSYRVADSMFMHCTEKSIGMLRERYEQSNRK